MIGWPFIAFLGGLCVLLAVFVAYMHQTWGPTYAVNWRRYGREWAAKGKTERAAWCHAWADYFELPWWKAVWFAERPSEKGPEA